MQNKIRQSLVKLEEYVQDKDYSGFDPYDALNSKKLRSIIKYLGHY